MKSKKQTGLFYGTGIFLGGQKLLFRPLHKTLFALALPDRKTGIIANTSGSFFIFGDIRKESVFGAEYSSELLLTQGTFVERRSSLGRYFYSATLP